MRSPGAALAALVVLTLAPGPAPAADRLDLGAVPRAEGKLEIDGVLDETAWQKALSIPLPYEVYPGDSTPAETPTTALLLFDDDNLYLG
ncbi:MAG: Carbohydrate family 9 binding domain-like, partial [Acidobacteria bacterium]|nr:Carbohydrate family 9 binding domain-like [Acidobacteriota bacterium]